MNKILDLLQKFLSLFNINISIEFKDKKFRIDKNKATSIKDNEIDGSLTIRKNENCEIDGNKFR